MQIDAIKKYLSSDTNRMPFFFFVSDEDYKSAIDELSVLSIEFINLSSFCYDDDKLPDLDRLISIIKTPDENSKKRNFVLKGLGEYLALRGKEEAKSILSELKDLNTGESKVVLLIRGLGTQIADLKSDLRVDARRLLMYDNADFNLTFTITDESVGLAALSGFKKLLEELESGRCRNIVVNTAINLDNSLFTINRINSAYEGIIYIANNFVLPKTCGSDEYWTELLNELKNSDGSLDIVFENHGLSSDIEADFYYRITGRNYFNWLYFICLKCKTENISNSYLKYVLDKTICFEDFINNVLNCISSIQYTDKQFEVFYKERKLLINEFPESDIANFVVNNRKVMSESIYRLTDNTKTEREEIIAWCSQNGYITHIEKIYPCLASYMKKYVFKATELNDLLSDYFELYKRQKLLNYLDQDFLKKVDELAISPRKYNILPTRNEVLDKLDKNDTYLYWLDAFGVEYLAFIEFLIQKRGLSFNVNIARAKLPTITSFNKDFYDEWQGIKEKNCELDEVKHKSKGGYNFINNDLPIHLAHELDIIESVIDKAATELSMRRCKRFIVVSDHGASRLAVMRRKEEKYETDTKGEHSGRCCKLFQPYDLPFAAEENGYLVLSDYGRFKGSRMSNVEVHGGASFEEVIIPIIELSLKDQNITVKLVDEVITVDYRTGTEIQLFINSLVKNVTAIINGKQYFALQKDKNHFNVNLPDIKRAGEYQVDIYAGDNLIDKIKIKAQGKSGKVNDAFDGLF